MRNSRLPPGPPPALLMVKRQSAPAVYGTDCLCEVPLGECERKELTPKAVREPVVDVVCGGDHLKQPRAGAVRAISFGDGVSSGCVAVYVRYCIFLLKRRSAFITRAEGTVVAEMRSLCESSRSSMTGSAR